MHLKRDILIRQTIARNR
jgi:hypothetical protein